MPIEALRLVAPNAVMALRDRPSQESERFLHAKGKRRLVSICTFRASVAFACEVKEPTKFVSSSKARDFVDDVLIWVQGKVDPVPIWSPRIDDWKFRKHCWEEVNLMLGWRSVGCGHWCMRDRGYWRVQNMH